MPIPDINDITKITLNEDDVLVVRVNRGSMPMDAFEAHVTSIKETLKTYFLSNNILVMSSDISMSVIAKGEQS